MMREIIEQYEAFEDVDILTEGALAGYQSAKSLFKSGTMPDGTRWSRQKTLPYPLLENGFVAGKIKFRPHGEKMTGGAELKFVPGGKNGHGGITVDPTASNQFLILEPDGVKGLLKAFAEAVKGGTGRVKDAIEKWVKGNRRQWFMRIVGVENADDWIITDVKLGRIKFGNPVTNHPERRKWPSGRSEIAMPFTVTVNVKAKRK